MSRWLRQSTAVDIALGPFLDSTDGVTAETALTISQADVRLKKNNGAWAQVNDATSATHEENGWYEKELDATDTNTLGILIIAVHESGALPVWHEFNVVSANVWDSLFSTDLLQVDVTQNAGTAITSAAGIQEVKVASMANNAIVAAAINADAFTAAKFAADVTTEFQNGLATAAALDAVDNLVDTEVAAILALIDTEIAAIKTVVDAVQAKTDNLPSDPADASVIAGLIDALPTAAENADAIWLETLADHSGSAGSTAAALNAAGAAGDPWSTAIPGAYGAGTAGKILGDNINATLSSRASQASLDTLDDLVDTEIAAIKAITDQFVFSTANRVNAQVFGMEANTMTSSAAAGNLTTELQSGLATAAALDIVDNFLDTEIAAILAAIAALSIPTANANADALLDRAAGVETGVTPRESLRIILSALAGKASGLATTTAVFRDTTDTKDRITATVDADGNRTAVTLDAT